MTRDVNKPLPAILFGVSILIFSIVSILSGCGPEKTEIEPAKKKHGGALYFGLETGIGGLDVLDGIASSGVLIPSMATLNNLIQEPLFRMDGERNPIPVLGLSASPSEKMICC